jgi:hypothetical protein
MTYEELCKYVFSEERVDWELHAFKSRKRQLVQARQISIYLANWFWPKRYTNVELTKIFGQDHSSAQSSFKTVSKLLFSDKQYRTNMDKYLHVIRDRIKNEVIEQNERLIQEETVRKKLLDTIDSMEIIARVYCDIKGMKLIKND